MEIPIINLASFCYDFIEQNKSIVSDLSQYDIDVSPNFDDIKIFISKRTCCNKYYNFIEEMIKYIQYVSCTKIIKILENNIDEIVKLFTQEKYIPVLITTNDSISKSNCFFSLYTLYKLKQKGVVLTHIYKTLDIIIKPSGDGFIMKESLNFKESDKVLIIFCDDISYSGNQLARHVNDLSLHVNSFPGVFPGYGLEQNYHKIKFNNKIKIFLNVCGLLPAAYNLVVSQFKDVSQLIIPPEVKRFKGILNLNSLIDDKISKTKQSKENFIKLNDCYILNRGGSNLLLESQFNKHLQINDSAINDLSFVYPFHKYPDAQSTYTKLCFIKRFDNLLSLNVEEFIKTYKITELKFCSFVQSSVIDLGELLKKAGVADTDSAILIKKISDNYDEPKNISDIKWIEVCKPVELENNFDNEHGKWFKTLQNLFKIKETTEKFKGSCDKIIPSFYKNLIFNYKGQQFNTKDITKSLEDIKMATEVSAKLKYIKYKTKYIQLKNMCKNLNS